MGMVEKPPAAAGRPGIFDTRTWVILGVAGLATGGTLGLRLAGADSVLGFVVSAIAPAGLRLIVAVALLVVFAASIPFSIRGGPGASAQTPQVERVWPLSLALGLLGMAGVGAAFVSDWFVEALKPAMSTLGLSESFVGL